MDGTSNLAPLQQKMIDQQPSEQDRRRGCSLRNGQAHPNVGGNEKPVNRDPDDIGHARDEQHSDRDVSRHGPRHGNDPVGAAIQQVAQGRQANHDVNGAVFSRHHPELTDDGMLRRAHGFHLTGGHGNRMRSEPDQKRHHQSPEDEFEIGMKPFPVTQPSQGLPDVIIDAEKQRTDGGGLDHEQPGQQPAHHGHTHLLTELEDGTHQPIPGKGHGEQGTHHHDDEHVTHPIVIRALFRDPCLQKPVRRIGHDHGPPGHDISQEPVGIQRIPQRRMQQMPDVSQELALGVHPRGRHHERRPGVGQQE